MGRPQVAAWSLATLDTVARSPHLHGPPTGGCSRHEAVGESVTADSSMQNSAQTTESPARSSRGSCSVSLHDWASSSGVRTLDISWFICDKMLRLEAVNGLNGIYQCILDTKPIQPATWVGLVRKERPDHLRYTRGGTPGHSGIQCYFSIFTRAGWCKSLVDCTLYWNSLLFTVR